MFPNIDCYREGHADEYRGRQSVTINGKQCQHWIEQTPQAHGSGDQPDEFIDGVFPGNYCRHPLRDNYKTEPWCYTMEPYTQYEMCGIPICTDDDGKLRLLRLLLLLLVGFRDCVMFIVVGFRYDFFPLF